MLAEWEAVQKESQVLREELKEDKWLTVFRTVTEQADGMMTSLEKAVNRCQVCVGMRENIQLADMLTCFVGIHISSAQVRSRRFIVALYVHGFNTLREISAHVRHL